MQEFITKQEEFGLHTKFFGPFFRTELYKDDGSMISSGWTVFDQHLDNNISGQGCMPIQGGADNMTARINRAVTIDGTKRWIRCNTEQEYSDKILALANGRQATKGLHPFKQYAQNWFEVYSRPNVSTVTAVTYQRQLTRYLYPAFDGKAVEEITADDIQQLFNGMESAKATKDKVRMVLGQVLDAAVEDGLISKNPLKSKRLRISGTESKFTKPYDVEQMRYLVQHIGDVQGERDRRFLAIIALHPVRLEEALGLKWGDIDTGGMMIHIVRAVTHPRRNEAEVKATKTAASARIIGLSPVAAHYLLDRGQDNQFVIGGDKPLSYTQVRKMCERIQRQTGFSEKITPIRFRTTVLSDLYAATKDVKLVQHEAGHTTAAMTLKHYVKGRAAASSAANAIANLYTE